MRYFALFVILFIGRLSSIAQTELSQSPMNVPSLISPYYFGPNAFPVPDMLDGRVEDELRIELSGDYFLGERGDHTENVFLKANH